MFSDEHIKLKCELFKDNRYTKWYYNLIVNAKFKNRKRKSGEDLENHHIIPKGIGGSNTSENLVLLTCREHFICHRLLTRMCIDPFHRQKMGMAISYFMTGCKNHPGRKFTSRDYDNARKDNIAAVKGICPDQYVMEAAWASRRGVPISEEQKLKLSIALKKPLVCQLIGPNDEIYDVEDLEKFCKENNLKYNYLRQLSYKGNDTRMVIPGFEGWGIYLGTIQPIGDYGKIRSKGCSNGWDKKRETGNIGIKKKGIKSCTFQDPNGNIIEVESLGRYCKVNNVPYNQPYGVAIGKVMVGKWAGWIKLSCTIL